MVVDGLGVGFVLIARGGYGEAVQSTLALLDALDADDAAGGGDAAHQAMGAIGAEDGWAFAVVAWADAIANLEPLGRDPAGSLFGDGSDGVDQACRDVAQGLVDAATRGEEFALIAVREALLAFTEEQLWATSWAMAWTLQRALAAVGGMRRLLALLAMHFVAAHGADREVHAAAERAALVVATTAPGREDAVRARLATIATLPGGLDAMVPIWAEVAACVEVPAPIVVLDEDGVTADVGTDAAGEDLEAFAAAAVAVAADDPHALRAAVDRVLALPAERLTALLATIALRACF